MSAYVTMPQLSDTMSQGVVVKWVKKEGEPVKPGVTIAEIETDKATMEMEAFEGGTLALILAKEGEKVGVGMPIALIATGSETVEQARQWHAQQQGGNAAASPAAAPTEAKAEASAAPTAPPQQAVAVAPPPPKDNGNRPIRVSPLARRAAAEKGVDLAQLRGSGPGGRIIQRDVVGFAQPSAPALAASAAPSGNKEVLPLSKMRLAIAKRLLGSKQNIPHFYESIDVDVEELSKLRNGMNKGLEKEGVRLSIGDFVSRAVAMALLEHPALNATFDGVNVTRWADVHLGMAVALPDGLIVPVLKNIHLLGVKEIRKRSVDLVERARTQRLKQDEMNGATFTLTNLGVYGVREFCAIVNPPEVAILAIGAAEKRAVVVDDEIVARTMMTVTLSGDHRVVDGATAAEFLRTFKSLLQEPGIIIA
ncbi:MAG: dihydrolipoamide acetyltransferase family protein [Tepidisphaeraceae bacterium]|jgi:pyruvate dehydrogenase E2 component (dihydrolipoamide acetyltransferase)